MDLNRFCLLALWLVLLVGCGRKYPVTEVSLAESGIEISDIEVSLPGAWNSWRGPTGDGIAPSQPLVTQWDEQTHVRWRSDVPGRGHGSPIVVGSSVYLATAIDDQQQQMVLCFDRASGQERWRTVIHDGGFPSAREVHKKATNANGTLACDGKHLYIGMLNSDAINATALDLQGEIVWQKEIGSFVSKFGYAPSPILYRSLVIFAADNGGGGYLVAVDGNTGAIAWRVARGNDSSYSSPIVAEVGGRDQLLIAGGEAVASYDPGTGQQNWRTSCLAASTCGTVVTDGQRILASGGFPKEETVCLDADGNKLWSDGNTLYEPSPIVVGDYLVGVKDDGIALCWSVDSGELIWKKRLGGNFSASPILCNDLVYVPNLKGETFVFRAGEEFEQIAKNRLGNDCYASPAVAGGELFLRIGVDSAAGRKEQLVCIAGEETDPIAP